MTSGITPTASLDSLKCQAMFMSDPSTLELQYIIGSDQLIINYADIFPWSDPACKYQRVKVQTVPGAKIDFGLLTVGTNDVKIFSRDEWRAGSFKFALTAVYEEPMPSRKVTVSLIVSTKVLEAIKIEV